MQLPPVNFETRAFQVAEWATLFPKESCVLLDVIYRQTDSVFLRTLNAIRCGTMTKEDLEELNRSCVRPFSVKDGIVSTKLFCKNVDVDQLNLTELAKLRCEATVFNAVDTVLDVFTASGLPPKKPVGGNDLFRSMPFGATVTLKVDAQVMLLANLDQEKSLVNGSRGVVVGFCHKSQVPEPMMKKAQIPSTWWQANGDMVPLVRFAHLSLPLQLLPREVEVASQTEMAKRWQLPLALCWAVTIHKAQGLTLDRATLDLSSTFAEGQSYTALSRVRGRDSLSLKEPLALGNIKTSADVVAFYKSME